MRVSGRSSAGIEGGNGGILLFGQNINESQAVIVERTGNITVDLIVHRVSGRAIWSHWNQWTRWRITIRCGFRESV